MDDRTDTGTWNYGLVARWWAEVNPLEVPELDFYRDEIEQGGEPALAASSRRRPAR